MLNFEKYVWIKRLVRDWVSLSQKLGKHIPFLFISIISRIFESNN